MPMHVVHPNRRGSVPGLVAVLVLLMAGSVVSADEKARTPDSKAAEDPDDVPRLATKTRDDAMPRTPAGLSSGADGEATTAGEERVQTALRMIADCKARYESVSDYTCTFFKRERIDGRLHGLNVMSMKCRTEPFSIYFKFQKPTPGREAIYVSGRHGGRAIAHDVGLGKLIAGTMALDPRGTMAMEGCRHPITEAGIGHMIDTIAREWAAELDPDETVVTIQDNLKVGDRPCTMISTTHPQQQPDFMFHRVKVYIDAELGLPIRFEAYDWPSAPGEEPPLVEEYTYDQLRLNVDLDDHDFDPKNRQYSFGRF